MPLVQNGAQWRQVVQQNRIAPAQRRRYGFAQLGRCTGLGQLRFAPDRMDTALYYLFSTSAQTLAAAAGFLAAMVLLRLQEWEGRIAQARDGVDQYWGPLTTPGLAKLFQAMRAGDEVAYEAAREEASAEKQVRGTLSHAGLLLAVLQELIPRRRTLIRQFWRALLAAAAAIAFDLVALPFVPLLAGVVWVGWSSAAVSLVGAGWAGVRFYKLLRAALRMTAPRFAGEEQEM
jgi:hypothetical protein